MQTVPTMPRRQKREARATSLALTVLAALTAAGPTACFREINVREAGVDAPDEPDTSTMPDAEAGAPDVVDAAPATVYRIITQPRVTLDQCVGNCLLPAGPRVVSCPGDRRMSLPDVGSALLTAIVWSTGAGESTEFSGIEWLYCTYLNTDGTLDGEMFPQRVSLAAMNTIAGMQVSPSPSCPPGTFTVGFRWAEYGVDTPMQRIVSLGFNCARAAEWATSDTAFTTTPILGQSATAGAALQDTNCPHGSVPTHFRVWQDERLRGIQLECSRFVP